MCDFESWNSCDADKRRSTPCAIPCRPCTPCASRPGRPGLPFVVTQTGQEQAQAQAQEHEPAHYLSNVQVLHSRAFDSHPIQTIPQHEPPHPPRLIDPTRYPILYRPWPHIRKTSKVVTRRQLDDISPSPHALALWCITRGGPVESRP